MVTTTTTSPLAVPGKGRFRWTIAAFMLAGLLVSALVVWQLFETTPARWCGLAKVGSPEQTTGCISVLLRLLDIKDHAVIGLIAILGMTVVGLTAVALGLRISGEGAGFHVDVSAEKTKISTDSGQAVVDTSQGPT